jgi:hypothetical protein
MNNKQEPPELIPMPTEISHFNGSHQRCDMASGPCCCGAWHSLIEWPEQLFPMPPNEEFIRGVAPTSSDKIYGVTYRGTDGETKAYIENGRVWITDDAGGWMRCYPGIENVFSPNENDQRFDDHI